MPDRTFNEFSASAGVLQRRQAANDEFALAVNVAGAGAQSGIHTGNFASDWIAVAATIRT